MSKELVPRISTVKARQGGFQETVVVTVVCHPGPQTKSGGPEPPFPVVA
jgi:hypothetical protein